MQAVVCSPAMLSLVELPEPALNPLRVAVEHCDCVGINFRMVKP